MHAKVSRGIKRLRVPMPYLALAEGVSNKPWAKSWIAARAAARQLTTSELTRMLKTLRDKTFGFYRNIEAVYA
eukprot:5891793-Amphidinium_carterae.1